jgi:FMN-dependent NADH-azoreductase
MLLYINACVRSDSRTKRLAGCLLEKLGEPYTEVCLKDISFPVTDENYLAKRDEMIDAGDFSDPGFFLANQFAAADRIVIAAPYWDLSFPAALKQYFEHINVRGITFTYTPEGIPRGLCRAKEIYYVMTAGGSYVPEEFGFGYVRALAQGYYGIQDVKLIQAVGLDLEGADPEQILRKSMESM